MPSVAASVSDLIRTMRVAWREKQFESVLARADDVFAVLPAYPEANRLRLKAALALERWDLVPETALALIRDHPDLALIAARKLMKHGEIADAARLLIDIKHQSTAPPEGFDEAINRGAAALLRVGTQISVAGDDARAITLWCMGAELAPENTSLKRKISLLRKDAVEHAKATDLATDPSGYMAAWMRVLDIDPKHLVASKRVAVAADKGDDARIAMECWARVLDIDKINEIGPLRFARAARRAGRESDALSVLQDAQLDDPNKDYVQALHKKVVASCKLALRTGDAMTAARDMVLLIRAGDSTETSYLRQRCVHLLSTRIRSARKADDMVMAVTLSDALLNIEPKDVGALSILGRYALKMRHFDEAAHFYERVVQIRPEVAKNWSNLARAKAKSGDVAGAAVATSRWTELEAAEKLGHVQSVGMRP